MIPFALHLANLRFASGGVRSARITGQLFALEDEEEDSIVLFPRDIRTNVLEKLDHPKFVFYFVRLRYHFSLCSKSCGLTWARSPYLMI